VKRSAGKLVVRYETQSALKEEGTTGGSKQAQDLERNDENEIRRR
jgi:hypothetical protein